MEETAKKITALKTKSMELKEAAKELMRNAKTEQKRVRTRGLCIMGNAALSLLGIRDIEQHQKIFEQICSDKKENVVKILHAALLELELQKRGQKLRSTQESTQPSQE